MNIRNGPSGIAPLGDLNFVNVSILDNTIHDIYQSCSETPAYLGSCTGVGFGDSESSGYDHIDGIQAYGSTGLQIRRNKFYLQGGHRQGIFLQQANGAGGSCSTDPPATFRDVAITDNFMTRTTDNAISIAGPGTNVFCGYVYILHNTNLGNLVIYNGVVAAGTPVVIANNLLEAQAGNQSGGGCAGMTYGGGSTLPVTWSKNLQGNTGPCPGDLSPGGTATFVQRSWPGGGGSSSTGDPDLHLAAGTQPGGVIAGGNGTYCTATDVDGQNRDCGVPDVGADKR